MIFFKKILVLMLMSMMTSVAFAQAPITENSAELKKDNIAYIERSLSKNEVMDPQDIQRVQTLIKRGNIPITGLFTEAENYYVQAGDSWTAYISFEKGCYWLSYYVTRNGKFLMRYSERID